jgi:hypothetical protein
MSSSGGPPPPPRNKNKGINNSSNNNRNNRSVDDGSEYEQQQTPTGSGYNVSSHRRILIPRFIVDHRLHAKEILLREMIGKTITFPNLLWFGK